MKALLWKTSALLAERNINLVGQVLDTRGDVRYAIYDINRGCDAWLTEDLGEIPHTICVRVPLQKRQVTL